MLISIMVFSGIYCHFGACVRRGQGTSLVQAYSAVFHTSQWHATKSIQHINADPMGTTRYTRQS